MMPVSPPALCKNFRPGMFAVPIALACLAAFRLSGGTSFFVEGVTYVTMMPAMVMWVCVGTAAILLMAGSLAAAYSRARGRSR